MNPAWALLGGLVLHASAAQAGAEAAPEATLPSLARQVSARAALQWDAPVAVSVEADSPALALAFQTLLMARLADARAAPMALDETGGAAETRARALSARTLLRVSLAVQENQLLARTELTSTWVNFFSGRTPTRAPTPAEVFTVAAPEDAQVQTLRVRVQSTPASLPVSSPVASRSWALSTTPGPVFNGVSIGLAVADLDGDGRAEVLALTDTELWVFDARGTVRAKLDLRAQPPRPVSSRAPVGMLSVGGQPLRIGYLSGRKAHGQWLQWDVATRALSALGAGDAIPCGASARHAAATVVSGMETFRVASDTPGPLTHGEVWACSAFERKGRSESLVIGSDGVAHWDAREVPGVGAGAALGDLDGDGATEFYASDPAVNPGADSVRVFVSGSDRPVSTTPLPGRVMQMAAGDVEGAGRDALVVASWQSDGSTRLTFVRRVTP